MKQQAEQPLIFESSHPGRCGWLLPQTTVPANPLTAALKPDQLRATPPGLPELAEIDLVRHYTALSRRNYGVDNGFYPLGSCTMKYNPKINEVLVGDPRLQAIHPLLPARFTQGTLALLDQLEQSLAAITGMDRFTLQPAAGAHGELTALLMVRAYHQSQQATERTKVLVPTSAHGTNPASAAMAGLETVPIKCNSAGLVELGDLKNHLDSTVAALMLTNPNTLGLFESEIAAIADLVHQAGGLLYYDGANLNAIMGLVRPGDMGFDLIHLNLHKTFATPHGGGGPGAGPVGVKSFLADFLPGPLLARNEAGFYWDKNRPHSIGRVSGFYGNFIVLIKALLYIWALGGPGLAQVSRDAVLNANYLQSQLRGSYPIPYDRPCMHEFVLSATNLGQYHLHALDLAKRLIDFGYHPPTIYFPLVVPEAVMIEPTETESRQTLDQFSAVLIKILQEAAESPELLATAPHDCPVGRVDETRAAREPQLRWYPERA